MQMEILQRVHSAFHQEYAARRKMLIERAKVTLQAMLLSKTWLDEQGTFEEARKTAQQGENVLQMEPSVKFQDIFTATLSKPVLF